MNKIILIGNITRTPELRNTPSGKAVLDLGIATNSQRKNPDGTWVTVPQFHTATFWGNKAEAVAKYFSKGSKIAIEGELQYQDYEKDGVKKTFAKILVNDFEFVERKTQTNEPDFSQPEPKNDYSQPDIKDDFIQGEDVTNEINIEDIPF